MRSLDELTGDPKVTAQEILDRAEDAQELMDAAAVVFAEVEREGKVADEAKAAAEASMARVNQAVGSADGEDFLRLSIENQATIDRLGQALERCQEAWRRYQPWKEALERLDQAIAFVRIIKSN